MHAADIRHFVQMMMCGIVPIDLISTSAAAACAGAGAVASIAHALQVCTVASADLPAPAAIAESMRFPAYDRLLLAWYDFIDKVVGEYLQPCHLAKVPIGRTTGFLYTVEASIKLLGFGITAYVPLLVRLLVLAINYTNSLREPRAADAEAVGVKDGDAPAAPAAPDSPDAPAAGAAAAACDGDDEEEDDDEQLELTVKRFSAYQAFAPVRTRALHRLAGTPASAIVPQ